MPGCSIKRALAIAALLLAGVAAAPAPPPRVEARVGDGDTVYEVVDGAAYRVAGGRRTLVDRLYDPGYFAKNYVATPQGLFRIAPDTGARYRVIDHVREGFEGTDSVARLIGPARGWTSFTLQSPRARSVADYNALRDDVMRGRGFRDNRIDITDRRPHSGARALCARSVAPSRDIQTAKASLETTMLHAARGQTVDASAWVYLERGMPVGVLDLEASYILNGPGLRVLFDDAGAPRVELKWATKPSWQAAPGARLTPGRWTHLRLLTRLSDRADGTIRLWLDDRLVIDARGQTLPLPSAFYDRLEVGITANARAETSLCLDDLDVRVQ